MKSRLIGYTVASTAMAGLLSLFMISTPATPAAAQGRKPAPDTTPVPRMSDGHPDFSGFYHGGTSGISEADEGEQVTTKTENGSIFFDYGGANNGGNDTIAPGQPPPYKPEYMAKAKGAIAATVYGWISRLDPMLDCKPQGVPRTGLGSAIQIVQNPKMMTIMFEDAPGPVYRIIYTDGRQHPTDLDTSYMGNSVGHWEADTLVVDTIGFNDETWLGLASTATIHSDKEHVIERFSRPGGKTIKLETTVEDPVMFTKPWVLPARTTVGGAWPTTTSSRKHATPTTRLTSSSPAQKDSFTVQLVPEGP